MSWHIFPIEKQLQFIFVFLKRHLPACYAKEENIHCLHIGDHDLVVDVVVAEDDDDGDEGKMYVKHPLV